MSSKAAIYQKAAEDLNNLILKLEDKGNSGIPAHSLMKEKGMIEIDSMEGIQTQLRNGTLDDCVVQNLDLRPLESEILATSTKGSVFLGCTLNSPLLAHLDENGSIMFPLIPNLPFNPYRGTLYSAKDLYIGFNPDVSGSYATTPDSAIYSFWKKSGLAFPEAVFDALLQRLHDHAISDAIDDFLKNQDPYKVVAIMGGHKMARGTDEYRKVAHLSWLLCKSGYLVVSGGGPGAMEASHLGALFANGTVQDIEDAATELAQVPSFGDGEEGVHKWLASAFVVLEKALSKYKPAMSLSIPTWLYGHEPSTPFASHIAKYFANSIREDGLVTLARGGIIYSAGSAGTIQEIFQDAAQNHYGSVGEYSPMVFLGTTYWTSTKPVHTLLTKLASDENKPYASLIGLSDDPKEIVEFIKTHPPIKKQS